MAQVLDFILKIRRPISVLVHGLLVIASNYAAFWLRFDGDIPRAYIAVWETALPWLVLIRLLTFIPFRLFEGLWRYASLWDLRNILLGVGASSALAWAFDQSVAWSYPRSVYVIDAVLLVCLLGGVRMARRLYREVTHNHRGDGAKKVLVYGAGGAGEMIVREMRSKPDHAYTPIGFIDDNKVKVGQKNSRRAGAGHAR